MSMSAFQVVVCHKLDSLWKMLLNEDQRYLKLNTSHRQL